MDALQRDLFREIRAKGVTYYLGQLQTLRAKLHEPQVAGQPPWWKQHSSVLNTASAQQGWIERLRNWILASRPSAAATEKKLNKVKAFFVEFLVRFYAQDVEDLWPIAMLDAAQDPPFLRSTLREIANQGPPSGTALLAQESGRPIRSNEVADVFAAPQGQIKRLNDFALFAVCCEVDHLRRVHIPNLEMFVQKHVPAPKQDRYIRQVRQLLDFFVARIEARLDFAKEAQLTRAAQKLYKSSRVQTQELVSGDVASLTFATPPAETLRVFLARNPNTNLQPALVELLRLFVDSAFWGTGFFHGNLTLDTIQVRDGKLLVTDFATSAQLQDPTKCALLDLMLVPSRLHSFRDLLPGAASSAHKPQRPRGIAKFFRNFAGLAPNQQKHLNDVLNPVLADDADILHVPQVVSMHEQNVAICKAFVRLAFVLCAQGTASFDDVESLWPKILDYSSSMDFPHMFGVFLDNVFCLAKDVFAFQLASHFLGHTMAVVHKSCVGCEEWDFADTARRSLGSHPVANFKARQGQSVCP